METEKNNGDGLSLDTKIDEIIRQLTDKQKQGLLNFLISWRKNELRLDARMPCLLPVDFMVDQRIFREFLQDLLDYRSIGSCR